MDLNGYKIDRALSTERSHGLVIRVSGKLEIIDSYAGDDREGMITGGKTTNVTYAGGVAVYNGGECVILGGTITGNTGPNGGVSAYSAGKLSLGGDVKIYGNTNSAGEDKNITISSTTGVIGIAAELTGGKKFGVTRLGNGAFTEGFGEHHTEDKSPQDFFISEDGLYRIVLSELDGKREGAMLSNDNAVNWLYTVQQSLGSNGAEKEYTLYSQS